MILRHFGGIADHQHGLAGLFALVQGDDLRADAHQDEAIWFLRRRIASEHFDDAFAVAGLGAGDEFFREPLCR